MNSRVFEPTIVTYLLAAAPMAGFLALLVFSLWKDARYSFRRKMSFLDSSTVCDVAEAREGERVAILGRIVESGSTLEAPLTGRPCVSYSAEVLVASITGSGRSTSSSLRTLLSKRERLDIEVRDDSGTAYVPAGAEAIVFVLPERRLTFAAGTDRNRERAFLAAHGVPAPQNWRQRWVERSRGFDECILVHGDSVIVGGIARWEAAPQDGPDTARRLRIDAPLGGQVVINADSDSIAHARKRRRQDGGRSVPPHDGAPAA